MPRSETSAAGRILAFFRSTDLPQALLVFDLVKDTVRERQQRSAEAKARVAKPPVAAVPDAPVRRKPGPKKGSKRGRKPGRRPTPQPLPYGPPETDQEAAAAAADAGDLH